MSESTPTPTACPPDAELVSFQGGKLGADRGREIASHLAACGECRAWISGMRDAAADRDGLRRRFGAWSIAAVALGICLVVALLLVVIAGERADRLVEDKAPPSRADALYQLLPEKTVSPGQVFPLFRRDETVSLRRLAPKPAFSRLYLLDPGKGMAALDAGTAGRLKPPSHRGFFVYLAIDFEKEPASADLAAFEKSADDFVRKSQPLIVLGSMSSWMVARNWAHQLIPVEWGD